MALADVAEALAPLVRGRQLALRGVVGTRGMLFVDVLLACLAQGGEGGRVATALRQAMAPVAERVCARGQAAVVPVTRRPLRGGDRIDVGKRQDLARVERELGRRAIRRPADDPANVLGAVAQPHAHALNAAHGTRGAPREQVELTRGLSAPWRRRAPGRFDGGARSRDGLAGLVQAERGAQVRTDVLTHTRGIDVLAFDRVQQPAGPLGAPGGVLGQVARDLAALVAVELAHVELVAPAHVAAAEFHGERHVDVAGGLERAHGRRTVGYHERISARPPTAGERAGLHSAATEPVLVMTRLTRTTTGPLSQLVFVARADRFKADYLIEP